MIKGAWKHLLLKKGIGCTYEEGLPDRKKLISDPYELPRNSIISNLDHSRLRKYWNSIIID